MSIPDDLVVGLVNHMRNATTRYSGDAQTFISFPIVRDLPHSHCSADQLCEWNARLLLTRFGN